MSRIGKRNALYKNNKLKLNNKCYRILGTLFIVEFPLIFSTELIFLKSMLLLLLCEGIQIAFFLNIALFYKNRTLRSCKLHRCIRKNDQKGDEISRITNTYVNNVFIILGQYVIIP